jgi:hypothetical protein
MDQTAKSEEPAPSNSRSDGDVVTLRTRAQKIIAFVKTAEREDEHLARVMGQCTTLVVRN